MQNNDSGDATAITVEQLPVFSQSDVAETSDEACSVLSFSSACADSEEQRNASPSFTVSVDGDAIDDKGDACCRICLEAIHASDFDSGSAIRLGCKCLDGLDVVHLHCAMKWFRLKRRLSCEICGAEVRNLPERFRTRLQNKIDATHREGFRFDDDGEATESADDSVTTETPVPEAFVEFFIYGLLPSLLTFLVLVILYILFLEISIGISILVACALALSSLIHYLSETSSTGRKEWHLVFVSAHLMTVLSITITLRRLYRWQGVAAMIGGTLLGPILAISLFAAIRTATIIASPMHPDRNSAALS